VAASRSLASRSASSAASLSVTSIVKQRVFTNSSLRKQTLEEMSTWRIEPSFAFSRAGYLSSDSPRDSLARMSPIVSSSAWNWVILRPTYSSAV
jgi:hypothetical protein